MMNKIFSFFHHLDNFFFKQIDKFKNSTYHQKYIEEISKLDENLQRKVNKFLGYSLFLLPVFIVFFLFLSNLSTKSDLSLKREIIGLISEVKSNKTYLNSIGKNIISQFKIKTMADMQNRLQVILEGKQISFNDVQVNNFNITNPISGISQIQADITFQNFSMDDFSNFLTGIMVDTNGKISSVSIKKIKNSLAGKIHFIQYEKSSKDNKRKK